MIIQQIRNATLKIEYSSEKSQAIMIKALKRYDELVEENRDDCGIQNPSSVRALYMRTASSSPC